MLPCQGDRATGSSPCRTTRSEGGLNRDLFSRSRQPTDWLCWTLIYHTTLEYAFWSGTFPMVKYHPRIQPLNTLFPLYKNYWVCLPSMDRLPLSRSWGGGPPPERQASPHPPWVLLQGFQLIDQFSRERKVQLLGNYTACLCQKLHAFYTNRKCTFHQNGQAKFHWMENSINLWRKKCDSHQLHSLWLGYHQVDQERLNT